MRISPARTTIQSRAPVNGSVAACSADARTASPWPAEAETPVDSPPAGFEPGSFVGACAVVVGACAVVVVAAVVVVGITGEPGSGFGCGCGVGVGVGSGPLQLPR
jgi:hypothetical protein